MVVVVIVHAPCKVISGAIPTHRTTTDLAHISPMHHHGTRATSGHGGNARSPTTTKTATSETRAASAAVTATSASAAATASTTVSRHRG
jgi:hypothetical protein